VVPAHERTSAITKHGVLVTKSFLDQVAVEEPEHSDALLNGGVRDRAANRLHRRQERADLNARHGGGGQLVIGKEAKEDLKSTAIRFERIAAEPPLGLKDQPGATEWVSSDERWPCRCE